MKIFLATIPLLVGRATSFTAVQRQNNRITDAKCVSSLRASVATEENVLSYDGQSHPSAKTVIGDSNVNIDFISPTPKKTSEPKASTDNARSALEKFVIDIKSLYQDLEVGGGSLRRDMNGLSFTYVAPVSSDNLKGESNNQLDGHWRSQSPLPYGEDADWESIHKQTTNERTKFENESNLPPLMVYLPGLDGFGISATNQFDDLSSTFELWRMTVDKGNTQLSFCDLLNSVVKFVDDATKTRDSPRNVMIVGESFGGLLACAVTMALRSSKYNVNLKGMVLVNPATSFDETNWEQFIPLLTSLRYLETQEEIVDDKGNFRLLGDFARQLPTPYSVSQG